MAYKEKYDIFIPPYSAQEVDLSALSEVRDWGHYYLKASESYGKGEGENSVVFIADTAGKFSHPDLVVNTLSQFDKNFSDSGTLDDLHGHGTHCAGIAAAARNGQGVIGIAPKAKLVALKVLNDSGAGSLNWLADSIYYVANLPNTGALAGKQRIISMSLGTPPGYSTPANLAAAIDYAISKGVWIVAAAGNSGQGQPDTVGSPGNYAPIMTIAAMDQNERAAGFSSQGPTVDFIAPGVNVYSTHKNGGYVRLSGTSMATPAVAGVLAWLGTAYPNLGGQAQVEQYLRQHIKDLGVGGRDDKYGHGAPIMLNYFNNPPGNQNPNPDPDPNPEPPKPEPPKPEPPKPSPIPRRGKGVISARFDLSAHVYVMMYKFQGEQGLRTGIIRDLKVVNTSDIKTDVVHEIVTKFVAEHFDGLGLVLQSDMDLYDAALWSAAFLQYASDDDDVKERFGTLLQLEVESLTFQDYLGNSVTVDQEEIANRVAFLNYYCNEEDEKNVFIQRFK